MATSVATGPSLPEPAVAPSEASLDGDLLIEQSREIAGRHLVGRDRLATLALAGGFAAAAAALAAFAGSERPLVAWTIALFVASYAAASRIDFEIGTGSTVPTQLVLVPMLALLAQFGVDFASTALRDRLGRGV